MTTFDQLRYKLVECLRYGCQEDEEIAIAKAQQVLSDRENKISEGKSAVDQAFRDLLKEMIEKKNNDDHDVKIDDFTCLIKICITCAKSGLASVSLPFILLVDIFDCLTLPVCQKIFTFVEQQILTWKETTFDAMGKVYILRMCNDLLRRLSRSQDTVFCGQIRLFLSRYFQLDERSGLNVMSHFNVDNVTSYVKREIVDPQSLSNEGTMDMEDGEISEAEDDDKKNDKNKTPIDYNLYYRFWSLQDFFSNPNLCYSNAGWNALTTSSRIVFDVFKSYKLEAITHPKDTNKSHVLSDSDMMEVSDSCGDQVDTSDRYFAKFLTNEKLLDLQLNDGEFRRTVLIQFLILFQYLTSSVKFRPANCTISERQQQWIERSTKLVYQLLEETPPVGKEFAKSVREVLAREEHWSKWKNDGCPSFVRHGLSANKKDYSAARKKRKISRFYTSSSDRIELGNQNLTRLWNLSVDNLSACKKSGEKFTPTQEEFFEEAIEQCDPEAQVEEEYKLVNNIVYRWRSFRVLAVHSPLIFPTSSSTSSSTTSKADFLANAITQMAKQSKDKKPTESDSVEVESIITDDSAMPLAIKEDLEDEDKLTDGD